MAIDADGCPHQTWRSDFAANGKMHEFCVACGAERRISQPADSEETARLRTGLRWIRHLAAMHALGGTCGPQQMRALTVLAEKVLDGADLADYDSSIGAARSKAQEWAVSVGVDLPTIEDLQDGATIRDPADPLPERRARPAQLQPVVPVEPDRGVVV
ncbi:MAG TPA: hypothetical protein VLR26_14105 [Frankiaceae bacterium]|nr:hypothetical protein [Frankiaceae bacterium]